jgi:hypothetical protein
MPCLRYVGRVQIGVCCIRRRVLGPAMPLDPDRMAPDPQDYCLSVGGSYIKPKMWQRSHARNRLQLRDEVDNWEGNDADMDGDHHEDLEDS